jgi:CheY-like chemotaxis protein
MQHAKRVLVIDDDEDLRDTITQVLVDEGWDVEGCGDGRVALARLRDETRPLPDLILLDLMMPVMNGWRFRVEQRGDARLGSIPVVLMTASREGRGDSGHERLARLRKPFNVDELLAVVEKVAAAR